MSVLDPFLPRTDIAYFSMEIALRAEIHTYAGGLGVLAGDIARTAAELQLPMVFVSLLSRSGYVRQEIDAGGRQLDHPDPWKPEDWASPLGAMIAVPIEGREVWVRPWLHVLTSALGNTVPVLLLDTDLEQNSADDQKLTDRLYGDGDAYRMKQEIVLGIGGASILRALGFGIETYHLNEGHAAFLTLHLLERFRRPARDIGPQESAYDHAAVRERCVFTTHTPVAAAHDVFSYPVAETILGGYIDLEEVKRVAGSDELNMTRLALNLSGYINGVAERHADTTNRFFPGYHVRAITNGVHLPTWTHGAFARLYQSHFPAWAHEPELLGRADRIADGDVWDAHRQAKADLIARIKASVGIEFKPDVALIGFARRMTGYKRPELLFTDVERLKAIAQRHPFQVVLAGIAHPSDDGGKQLIERIHRHISDLADSIPIVFLPNYDMTVAASVVSGVDIWLNTPLPPFEASGTSGMKAAANGVVNLSVLDGWWVEACIHGVNGWGIGGAEGSAAESAAAGELYAALEEKALAVYYQDRKRWIWMMKQSIGTIASFFNSHRMMRRYATEAYVR